MGRDQDRDAAHFEWVNAWAALSKAEVASTDAAKAALTAPARLLSKLKPAVKVQVIAQPIARRSAHARYRRD